MTPPAMTPPGASERVLEQLGHYESRNVTYVDPAGGWPIVWERARGVHVWDAEGRKYLDLTAAFGVAAAGHANPRVVAAGRAQMGRLLHAMGDVHPHARKAELARELSALTLERWTAGRPAAERQTGKTIFCNSGFEAVEAALKTALLATGRSQVIAFEQGYHGLGYGALNVTHREHFRGPFAAQLGGFAGFAPFPTTEAELTATEGVLRRLFQEHSVGAVVVEPIQVRGGVRVPPPGFLPRLRELADEHGALLVLDEIYTGFGRTGRWFAAEHAGVVPDLVCLGKALTGGFPLSACVGRADVMDAAWPAATGEAIHTSTYLGHPVGCAMALAQLEEIQRAGLVARSAELGRDLLDFLNAAVADLPGVRTVVRGLGLLAGVEVHGPDGAPAVRLVLDVVKDLLGAGHIVLPEGPNGNIIGFSPPLTITKTQLAAAAAALGRCLRVRLSST